MNVEETLWNLFQAAVDRPHYELVADARANLAIITRYISLRSGAIDTATILMAIVSTFFAADGKLAFEELSFLQDVLQTDISGDALLASVNAADNLKVIDSVDAWIDHAPQDVKQSFVMLGLDLIACDGEITPAEKALLLKYWA